VTNSSKQNARAPVCKTHQIYAKLHSLASAGFDKTAKYNKTIFTMRENNSAGA
jgi:hypothetical protein